MALTKVEVTGTIRATDHETIGENQRETATVHGVAFPQSSFRNHLVAMSLGVGGEVRVELALTVRLLADRRVVEVEGTAKLFEGSSENTQDLEDERAVSFTMSTRGTQEHRIFLHNGGEGGGDKADINLTFTTVDLHHDFRTGNGTPFTARHSGKVLDVAGVSTALGAPITQWAWLDGANQRFHIEPVDDHFVRLVAVHSGLVLDVGGASMNEGAPLIQWEWLGQDNQLFLLVPQTEGLQATTDGYLEIRAKHSGLVLDVAGAATKNGAPIIQWSTNRRRNQQWIP